MPATGRTSMRDELIEQFGRASILYAEATEREDPELANAALALAKVVVERVLWQQPSSLEALLLKASIEIDLREHDAAEHTLNAVLHECDASNDPGLVEHAVRAFTLLAENAASQDEYSV